MTSLRGAYLKTYQSLKNNRVLFLPFLIFVAFDFLALMIIYLAPRMPLKLLLGPIIRALEGEQYLHYPLNFFLIPKWTSGAKIGLTVIFGSFLTGVATLLVYKIYTKSKINLKEIFKLTLKKYIGLFAIVLIFTLFFHFLDKITTKLLFKYFYLVSSHSWLKFLAPKALLGPIYIGFHLLLATLVQSVFIYAIPVLLIEGQTLTKSLLRSVILFKKLFLKTTILVGLPMLIYIPIIVLQTNSAFLVYRVFPESVLLVAILSLAISSLVIDLLVTLTATNFYLMYKNE